MSDGTEFGHFVDLERIAGGGMGVVYRAFDTRHQRPVALKLLHSHLAADPGFVARFHRECAISAQLQHPNIVPIFEYNEIDGTLYIAMQCIDGTDLAALVEQGPIDVDLALGILDQVARALDHAHRKGVEHRDVKPSNILLDPAVPPGAPPFAYLTDFGIARPVDASANATATAGLIGSSRYMAPERIQGRPSSGRSDVYSLTCVLYEMLTGRRAFPDENDLAALYAHVNRERPRPSDVVPSLPAGLDDVVAKGLAVEPENRYPSARALFDAAAASTAADPTEDRTAAAPGPPWGAVPLAPTTPLGEPAHPRRRGLRAALVVAGVAAVAGAAIGIGALSGGSSGPDRAGSSPTVGDPGTSDRSVVGSVAGPTSPAEDRSTGGQGATPTLAVGTCVDAALTAVSCEVEHAYEVYAQGSSCTSGALLTYLGGLDGTDVLNPAVTRRSATVSGSPACLVQGPTAAATGSARGVLQNSGGARWRRCVAVDGTTTVGCNVKHVGEYVFAGRVAAGQSIDCSAKASAYLDTALTDFAAELRVTKAVGDDAVACALFIRGGNVLTSSVRGIRNGTLPEEPR